MDIFDDEAFIQKYFEKPIRELAEKKQQHDEYRDSKEFQEAINKLKKITHEFCSFVFMVSIYKTRSSEPDPLVIAMRAYYIQSVVGILKLVEEGLFGPARRELRFLLESSLKFIIVDQRHGKRKANAKIEELENLQSKFKDIVSLYEAPWASDKLSTEFRYQLIDLYTCLSRYIHTSKTQVEQDFLAYNNGQELGFEDVKTLKLFVATAFKVYDVSLVMFLQSLGFSMAGDVFLQFDDEPQWSFHQGKFMKAFNACFDYKHERNDPEYWKDKNPKRYKKMSKKKKADS